MIDEPGYYLAMYNGGEPEVVKVFECEAAKGELRAHRHGWSLIFNLTHFDFVGKIHLDAIPEVRQ